MVVCYSRHKNCTDLQSKYKSVQNLDAYCFNKLIQLIPSEYLCMLSALPLIPAIYQVSISRLVIRHCIPKLKLFEKVRSYGLTGLDLNRN